MIASVSGLVTEVGTDRAVIEVGGLGLVLLCTPATLSGLTVGEHARLASALVVREDSLTLFGFTDASERTLFEVLLATTGVGPKLAQAMLGTFTPGRLCRAIADGDLATLVRIPGIGRKGAERIVLELKEKVLTLGIADTGPQRAQAKAIASTTPAWTAQVHAGLLGLGWSSKQADAAVEFVAPEAELALSAGEDPAISELLKHALRSLARTGAA